MCAILSKIPTQKWTLIDNAGVFIEIQVKLNNAQVIQANSNTPFIILFFESIQLLFECFVSERKSSATLISFCDSILMAGSESSVQGWAESDQGIAAINQQQRGIQASYLRENEFYNQFFSDSLIS